MAEKHRMYDEEGYPDFEGMSAAHVELWTWLADNPDKGKDDWPGWEKNGEDFGVYDNTEIVARCFLCEAMQSSCTPCEECPLTDDGLPDCYATGSLFQQWARARKAGDYNTAQKLAMKIRDAWRW